MTVPAEPTPRPTSFFTRWLSSEGHLGLHLVVGFVGTVVGVIAFTLIADHVFDAEDIVAADARAQQIARSLISPRLMLAMVVITQFGGVKNMVWMSLLVCLWLLRHHSRRRLYAFVAAMLGGGAVMQLLKLWFRRARPEDALATAYGYSFPSGHSMASMLFFASLGYVLLFSLKEHKAIRGALVGVCIVSPLLIGASRIYIGVHYFTDVVAGYFAALAWAGVCVSSIEGWVRWRRWRVRLAAAAGVKEAPVTD